MDYDLRAIFNELNTRHFDGWLTIPKLEWNSRIRSSAGRFIPVPRKYFLEDRPTIEIATYLKEEPNALELIKDTLAHEMIHFWLYMRRRPFGHNAEFYAKLKIVGASRYNSVPRTRPYKWVYRCGSCRKEFFARRKLKPYACGDCCKKHNDGRFDARFKLVLDREFSPADSSNGAEASQTLD